MKMLVKIELAITILFLTKTNLEAEEVKFACATFCIMYSDGNRIATFLLNNKESVTPRRVLINKTKILAVSIMGDPPKPRGITIQSTPSGLFTTGKKKWKCIPRVEVDGEWNIWEFDDSNWRQSEVIGSNDKCIKLPDSQLPCVDILDPRSQWISTPKNTPGINDTKAILCRINVSGKIYDKGVEAIIPDGENFGILKIVIIAVELVVVISCVILYAVHRHKKIQK